LNAVDADHHGLKNKYFIYFSRGYMKSEKWLRSLRRCEKINIPGETDEK
jgi:hypothetical protein